MENEKRLIYANVAIEKCNKLLDNGDSCPIPAALEGVKIVRDLILSECETGCPTVDAVEVVHGRWIKTCLPDIYQCTNCKRATKMDELCDSEILRAYCPNCGAKMAEKGAKNGK